VSQETVKRLPSRRAALMATLLLAPLWSSAPGGQEKVSDAFQTGLVLKSVREYCQRLERAALDFVCMEEVSEKLDASREKQEADVRMDPRMTSGVGGVGRMGATGPAITHNPSAAPKRDHRTLFDYQFVRRQGQVTENRVMLERDGKKAKPKEKPPQMNVFSCSEILLMPMKLLDEKISEYYDYRLLRQDELEGVKVWVLEVSPRLSIKGYLGGRLWIGQQDSSVLRIEWDPTTFGHYDTIRQNAAKYKETPAVSSYTDFGVAKNGVRFPSIDYTEEAYVDAAGKKFVRSETKVLYRDYKFFTVETETTFKK